MNLGNGETEEGWHVWRTALGCQYVGVKWEIPGTQEHTQVRGWGQRARPQGPRKVKMQEIQVL